MATAKTMSARKRRAFRRDAIGIVDVFPAHGVIPPQLIPNLTRTIRDVTPASFPRASARPDARSASP